MAFESGFYTAAAEVFEMIEDEEGSLARVLVPKWQ